MPLDRDEPLPPRQEEMETYGDGHGGVLRFRDGGTYLWCQFRDGMYLYDETRPGVFLLNRMKVLARRGTGLTTFISQHVKGNYARKI